MSSMLNPESNKSEASTTTTLISTETTNNNDYQQQQQQIEAASSNSNKVQSSNLDTSKPKEDDICDNWEQLDQQVIDWNKIFKKDHTTRLHFFFC